MANTKQKKQAGRKRKRRQLSERRTKERRRTKVVGVRLSEEEWDDLAAQAKSKQLTKAAILRNGWLGVEPTTVPIPEVLGPATEPPRIMSTAELADYQKVVTVAVKLDKLTDLLQPNGQLHTEVATLFGELRYFLRGLVPPRVERRTV